MMYDRSRARISCPTCRKPVTTIFKLFEDSSPVTEEEKTMGGRIKEYNYLYDDNRGVLVGLCRY